MIVSTTDEIIDRHQEQVQSALGFEITTYPHIDAIPEEVASRVEILITYGNDLTDENVLRFRKLKWIQMLSAGLEDLPFEQLVKQDVMVTNAKGIHPIPMSEYVIGGMLHFEKHFDRYMNMQNNQEWDREILVGELNDRKVLIYGTGAIGVKIAEKAKCFDMVVHGVNTSGRPVEPFDHVLTLEEAEEHVNEYSYVVCVLPLTDHTAGIFNQEYLEKLNENAVFINVGRGGLVDEDALVEVLNNEQIYGAVLDVFQTEPLPKGHPLWEAKNTIITPHMSAKSYRYLERCMNIFIDNYTKYKENMPADEMVNIVDLHRHY
ncbi:D-2-hydroxyacid dehydrogenase [Alkalibacillus haloalkaliphilus]|uniref:D-2-hydroxyacid dehydrogenase n=1 Tax=Alkalibacillus haloalkaliphilus TaxID=94136 RepID=UPI002935C225|nr:D-2-hydroxyacid dehydrogenase [Alkalibacillus haloalkaliphilus]MDV2582177.1 D-2-hydroxyacid dehydrogenase [Alkalibacillus haloalkaliphilus]